MIFNAVRTKTVTVAEKLSYIMTDIISYRCPPEYITKS